MGDYRFALFPLTLGKQKQVFVCARLIGGLAQLARASALQAEGQGFESLILHFLFLFPLQLY